MLRWAYDACRLRLREQQPDVILVHSPHWQTVVGHHVLAVPTLQGLSMDPVFPHLFRYNVTVDVDCALAQAIVSEAQGDGLEARLMEHPGFRVDYATIVTLHLMNPSWDLPIVGISVNNSPYFHDDRMAQEEMTALGNATRRAIEKIGRRAVLAASNRL